MTKQKRYQIKHIENGLCIRCPLPAVEGKQLCEKHLESDRKRCLLKNKKYKDGYRASRRCVRCSCDLESFENLVCTNCIEQSSRRTREAG